MTEACRQLNIKLVTYRHRIARGFSKEQALELESFPDGRRGKKYEVEGNLYTTKELSSKYSIPLATILDRLRRGASIRQAIGLDPIEKGRLVPQSKIKRKQIAPINLKVGGKLYKNYQSLADDYDLPVYVVRQRIVDYGYTPEEAVLSDGKGNTISFKGKIYQSNVELAEAFDIDPEAFQARLTIGWTLEEATGLEKRLSATAIEYEGEHFDSMSHLGESVGIAAQTLRKRVRSGMTLKEAVSAGERLTTAGRYNQTILERDPELASTPSFLYFASLMIDGTTKHKIGITSRSVDIRLQAEGFEYEIIKVVEDTLLNCFLLEQELLDLLSDKRDHSVTSEMMDGYTEILSLNKDDVSAVLELIDSN